MNRLLRIAIPVFGLAACAPSATPPAQPAPSPSPAPAARPTPAAPAPDSAVAPAAARPSDTWWLQGPEAGYPGIGMEAARSILAGRQPKRSVVVAIIDSGIDTAHAALHAHLWANPKEVPGNGRDDDGDGYVDDYRGWNYIGGPDGDVDHDTFEVTRLHVRCTAAAGSAPASVPVAGDTRQVSCDSIASAFDQKRQEAEQTMDQVEKIDQALKQIVPVLRQALGGDSVTVEAVRSLSSPDMSVQRARAIYLNLADHGVNPDVIAEAKDEYGNQLQYGLNTSYDPRHIVGDDYADKTQRSYGNSDVVGPEAMHGTHVSGIVMKEASTAGAADSVRIMVVRTVPDGDERDKDVANAIRFAADHGANVINMSFGKPYSPSKPVVDDAVRYAQSKGVLMIHAAGNDAEDLAQNTDYPNRNYVSGGSAENWMEIGAASWKGADTLAASFSNYGKEQVDVFAPGVDILSSVPGGGYKRESGTSMASPVVTGVAAVLMAYFPSLHAADVKDVLMKTARTYPGNTILPGTPDEMVPFATLSRTGAIVDAAAAIREAIRRTGGKA